jgi:hypothetical protein
MQYNLKDILASFRKKKKKNSVFFMGVTCEFNMIFFLQKFNITIIFFDKLNLI